MYSEHCFLFFGVLITCLRAPCPLLRSLSVPGGAEAPANITALPTVLIFVLSLNQSGRWRCAPYFIVLQFQMYSAGGSILLGLEAALH